MRVTVRENLTPAGPNDEWQNQLILMVVFFMVRMYFVWAFAKKRRPPP